MKAIIIDDEKRARILLRAMLEDYFPQINVLGDFEDVPSGVEAIKKSNPDIVFLDIELPGISGLKILDYFENEKVNFSIIFVTAYNEYAIQAFRLSAIDYILKPINSEHLITAVEQFEKIQHRQISQLEALKNNLYETEKKILIPSKESVDYISPNEIVYVQADGSYTNFYLKNGKRLMLSKNLRYVEELLAPFDFLARVHKSFIVNRNEIRSFSRTNGKLMLSSEVEIAITNEKLIELGLK